MAWQALHMSLGGIVILDVQHVAHLACHRIEYRDGTGRHVMQIDDRQLCRETLSEREREVWQAAIEWERR